MNKEYTISTITNNTVYNNICSFFSACNHTPVYTANNITVYRDETLSFYIIVYAISDEYVYFSFSREWDSNNSWYAQHESLRADKLGADKYFVYVLPCREGTLICNYTESTFMFSMVEDTTIARRTYFTFFGRLNNIYSEFTDHYLIGSTWCRIVDSSGNFSETSYEPYLYNDFGDIVKDTNNKPIYDCGHTLYMALYVNVDNSPAESRGHVVWATDHKFTSLTLVTSFSNDTNTNSLPVYTAMLSKFYLQPSYNYTQLNGITLCLPIICYVSRDPQILDKYSVVGSTDVLTFVDMYNIHSGRMTDSDFPVKKQDYQCFSIYTRRNHAYANEFSQTEILDMFKGFAGIAFKQEIEEESE